MPGTTDGLALARIARARRPTLPVLLTTGYAPDALARRGVGASRFPVLDKPYRRADLLAKVREALDSVTRADTRVDVRSPGANTSEKGSLAG
jgi:CheY-like chemotaxis protein